jgi:Ribbon-helix-helix protein, copG family
MRCILYIVRRTQLYLDDDVWTALHARAQGQHTTISELVREAIRERYLWKLEDQAKAMQAFVGSRKRKADTKDAVAIVRNLRRGHRLEELARK